MTNILKQTYAKRAEWILKVSSINKPLNSETFSFNNYTYSLILDKSKVWANILYLYITVNEELTSPITITVNVAINSGNNVSTTISISNTRQQIWSNNADYIFNQVLNVEILFHADFTKDDKSLQTPSYIDTRFLLDDVSSDFSKLLDEGLNHDVEFTCGDQKVKAHKNILCSRSEVFASMLQSDMVEGKTGRVNIQDMEATIFQMLLKYLYTGVLPDLTVNIAMEFYKAGDKYAKESLKKLCSEFLTDNLTSENACEILVLADRHNDPDLKKNVMEYMFKEKIPIVGENWNDFCKENYVLANEVLNLFCQYLNSK